MNLHVIPEALATAAGDLTNIGTTLSEANSLAAAPTTAILPAAADEVSAGIAQLFGEHGLIWQEIAAQQEALHQQFVALLAAAENLYQEAEDANALTMRQPGYTSALIPGTDPPEYTIAPTGGSLQPVGIGENLLSFGWGGVIFDQLDSVVRGVVGDILGPS